MEHITLDEMTDFIYADRLDAEIMRLGSRVNAHVLTCPQCMELYDTIYKIHQLEFDKGRETVLERLKESTDQNVNLLDQVILQLQIEAGRRLILKQIEDQSRIRYYYSHPLSMAVRGGSGQQDESRLVDDDNEYNRITIEQGILKLELDAEDYPDHAPRLIVYSEQEILYDDVMHRIHDRYVANVAFSGDGAVTIKYGY